MEHSHLNPNLATEPSGNYGFEGPQDEGGVDTNIAGPSGIMLHETSFRHLINYPNTRNAYWVPGVKIPESKESLLIKLEINQSIETTKLNNDNGSAKTLEFDNKDILETIIQDKESGKNHYICKFCSQVFDKHQALGGHMNGHSKDQRNLEKFGKVTSWIHATYPPSLHKTLASDVELQGTPTNGVAFNSYNHLEEVDNVYSQLGGQWTNQQSTQQIQLSLELQIQQQLQYYQAQELQRYQYSQGLQCNQAPERLQSPQALQSPQNYQTPQGLQNHQASQGSQSYQTLQQFQNYQTPQVPKYYQALQGSQNYQVPQGLQYYQAPQRFQNYQTPQGPQRYQNPQGSQSYQALQGCQIYQTPQGQWQQLVANVNNQQNINLNSKTSNKPKPLSKAPSNEQKCNSSNSQGLHVQKEAQGPQRYMPNPYNLRNGDCLTTGPFINEQMNMKYYAKLGPNVMRRSNQMISIAHDYNIVAQERPANSPNTSGSFIQSKDE